MPVPGWQDQLRANVAAQNEAMDDYRQRRAGSRADWTDADWSEAFRRATTPQSRQRPGSSDWEYMVKGSWVPQRQFEDPMWRKNVYDPWMAEVQNYWRLQQEKARGFDEGAPNLTGGFQGRRRPAGRVRSGSSGGFGGYDPAMLEFLTAGG